MKKTGRGILSLALAVVILAVSSFSSSAAYTGKVYMFTYDSGRLPGHQDFAEFRINTRRDAEFSLPWLWDMNYDAGEYLNNSVDAVHHVLPNASVVTIGSHGLPGRIYCADASTPRMTMLVGTEYLRPEYHAKSFDRQWPLTATKLIIFASCQSALTDEHYGNLLNEAVTRGADAALGWNGNIPVGELTSRWQQYFFTACYFLHCDVKTAADTATNRLRNEFPGKQYDEQIEKLSKFDIRGSTTIY